MKLNRNIILCSLVCSTLLYAHEEPYKLDDLTVTANKIEENIKDVPQSITVISSEELEEKGLTNIIDVMNQVPGMNATTSNGTAINFRGLNTSLFTRNNPVVIYINGVPSSNKFDFDPLLVNVERIEVLRGPQSTLYGKDAIGAVINIITKEDSEIWSGSVNTEYGSNNYTLGRFNLNGPIIDNKLFFGISGEVENDDGWISNNYPGQEKNANKNEKRKINTFFTYKVNDNFTTKLSIANSKEDAYWKDGFVTSTTRDIKDIKRDEAENVSVDGKTQQTFKNNSQSLSLKYAFNTFDLSSITTFNKYKTDGIYDRDYGANPSYKGLSQFDKTKTTALTQEIRLSSRDKNDFKWVTGLYFEDEEQKSSFYGMDYLDMSSNPRRNNIPSDLDNNTYAAFGQIMLPITKDLELTLGGRYQKIKKSADIKVYDYALGTTQPNTPMMSSKGEETWNEFIPKIALSYKLNKDWTSFASITKGYLPGGFNFYNMSNNINEALFKPQTSTNYEIGIKGSFQDTILSVSAFRMDIKDIHVFKVQGPKWLTDNAERALSQGIELEARHFINDNWEVSASIGFTDAKYKKYDAGNANYNGQNIQNTPEYTANVGLAYFADNGFYGRTDINLQGKTAYFNSDKKIMDKANEYIVTNLKLGYKTGDWDFYTYVNNIFDEDYIKSYDGAIGLARVDFGDPRTVRVGLRYTF